MTNRFDKIHNKEAALDVAEDGLAGKLAQGNTNFDVADGLDVAQTASSFALNKGLKFIPGLGVGDVVGGGIGYVADEYRAESEKDALRNVAKIDVERLHTKAAKRKLDQLGNRSTRNLGRYLAQAVGAVAAGGTAAWIGGAIGTVAIPIPVVGTAIGLVGALAVAAVGGWAGGRIYDSVVDNSDQDAVKIAAKTYLKQERKEQVSAEEMFAQLVANLPDEKQTKLEDMLEKRIGTRDFSSAIRSQDGMQALREIMNSSEAMFAENLMRVNTGISIDYDNPTKHVWEQYADLINSNYLDARDIVRNPSMVARASNRSMMEQSMMGDEMATNMPIVNNNAQLPVRNQTKAPHI